MGCAHRRLTGVNYDTEERNVFAVCADCDASYLEIPHVVHVPLDWTADQPEKPGLYWFKGIPGNAASEYSGVVLLDECGQVQLVEIEACWNLHHFDGEWAGPLEVPR